MLFIFLSKYFSGVSSPQGNRLVAEVLIQLSSWPSSMMTWELEEELKHQFPAAPPWGQAGFQGRGNASMRRQARHEET
jgi:hypothetical protein